MRIIGRGTLSRTRVSVLWAEVATLEAALSQRTEELQRHFEAVEETQMQEKANAGNANIQG